jgi:hypothetical protein
VPRPRCRRCDSTKAEQLPLALEDLDLVVTFSQLVSRAEALKHLVERVPDLVSQVAHMIQLRSRP